MMQAARPSPSSCRLEGCGSREGGNRRWRCTSSGSVDASRTQLGDPPSAHKEAVVGRSRARAQVGKLLQKDGGRTNVSMSILPTCEGERWAKRYCGTSTQLSSRCVEPAAGSRARTGRARSRVYLRERDCACTTKRILYCTQAQVRSPAYKLVLHPAPVSRALFRSLLVRRCQHHSQRSDRRWPCILEEVAASARLRKSSRRRALVIFVDAFILERFLGCSAGNIEEPMPSLGIAMKEPAADAGLNALSLSIVSPHVRPALDCRAPEEQCGKLYTLYVGIHVHVVRENTEELQNENEFVCKRGKQLVVWSPPRTVSQASTWPTWLERSASATLSSTACCI